MLINSEKLYSSHIKAIDGELGNIEDIYFDDQHWTVRFLVIDTHRWLPLSQRVLLSPIALLEFSEQDAQLEVSMTKEKVKNSPKVEDQDTVSRQFEKEYYEYFGYGYYWTGMDLWGDYLYPGALSQRGAFVQPDIHQHLQESKQANEDDKENHLRSAKEVLDYDIHIDSADSGNVEDFIWDTYDWSLKYVVVNTGSWMSSERSVLVDCKHIENIKWDTKSVKLDISVAQLEQCPTYDPDNMSSV